MSYLYLSNIVGSTAGTVLVGLILMDYLSMRQISVLLLLMGLALATLVYGRTCAGPMRILGLATGAAIATPLILSSGLMFNIIYERMLFKDRAMTRTTTTISATTTRKAPRRPGSAIRPS
jgi:spermidine synthase